MYKYHKNKSRLFFIALMVIFQIHSTSAENVQVQALNKDVKENTVSGNNTKLNQLAPQYSNELVAYNQLLPYIYSKLPIPVSLINQLRKYNINKNMLNKIHSYNRLRRELHSKLIENEISGYKYNDILSKKLQNLFKSVNQEEKKNFLNLINYLKMFNFDNNKLYNTLHDGNDLFKLINDNKIKYLPFMNSDKMLPDIFTNNKVNKEIKRILIQYKISSKDLYNKLINKINPVLLKDMNKNSAAADPEQKVQIKNVEANNPYELLKERIEDLTSFNKKPRILPLNKELPKAKVSKNINIQQVNTEQKKLIDGSLDKYIKELKLLNEIEKEKDQLCNTKIEDLINPKKNTNEQKTALLQPNPNAALLALYMVLSIPGILSALPDKTKKLPYIRKSKEDILHHSHIEAGKLYSYLINKNVKESLKKIHAEMKKEKHRNKQEGLNINEFHGEKEALDNKKNPVAKNPMKSRYHPFGHQHSHVLVDDNYYDAPQLPQYEMNPLKDEKSLKINAHELYSALQGRNKLASNKLSVHGKHENAQEKHVDFKIGGKQLFAHLQGLQNNSPKDQLNKQNVDHKIDGKILFDRLAKSEKNKGGWKEDTIYSKKSDNAKQLLHNEMNVNEHEGGLIDGRILFNLLKDKQSGVNRQRVMNKIKNDETNRIKGQDLFDLLDPSRQYMYKAPTGAKYGEPKVNMNKFYEKLYREFMKDNNGILNAMNSKTNQNKAVWHDQNLEIPNISAIDMNEISKQNVVKAEHDNNEQEPNGGKYKLEDRKISLNLFSDLCNSTDNVYCNLEYRDPNISILSGNRISRKIRRSRRSINFDDISGSEYRERQATLGFVLNNILNHFTIPTRNNNISNVHTKRLTTSHIPNSQVHLNTSPMRVKYLGCTTDFMFSKDADIDPKNLADFFPSTTPKNHKLTSKFRLADIEKPKNINKELLLIRIHHLKKAIYLNYSCPNINSRIKNIIMRFSKNITTDKTNISHHTFPTPTVKRIDNAHNLEITHQTQYYNETDYFETFRPYSKFRTKSSSYSNSTKPKLTNKTLIVNKLRSNMLPDIATYHAERRIVEMNGTYVVYLSKNDKITGADYVDDLLALYPDDPDILEKKFDKNQLEKQLASYNEIFNELSKETKRKYYITLDIFSRLDHLEQVKTGAKIVITNVKEETPSSDELKVLYDEFSHDITDDQYGDQRE